MCQYEYMLRALVMPTTLPHIAGTCRPRLDASHLVRTGRPGPTTVGQNGQNSKLTDGAYFLLDGYPSRTVVLRWGLHFSADLAGERPIRDQGASVLA